MKESTKDQQKNTILMWLMVFPFILISLLATGQSSISAVTKSDRVKYITVDSLRTRHPLRNRGGGGWFGYDIGYVNNDDYPDIVSGSWLYINPGEKENRIWEKFIVSDSLDAILSINVDNDEYPDLIAVRCNEQYWLEASDYNLGKWEKHLIGNLPVCDHRLGTQGYLKCDLDNDGKNEIVLTGKGIYSVKIPQNPLNDVWEYTIIQEDGSNGEGIVAGDFDSDGDLDLVSGLIDDNEGHSIYWWENTNGKGSLWTKHFIGRTIHDADRFAIGDFNGDNKTDIVVSEERYPGLEKDANLFWFNNNGYSPWKRHTILTAYSLNNLDTGDFDGDGKIDIVTAEQLGPERKLFWIKNTGYGNFEPFVLDSGKELHLGAKLIDLNNDGYPDISGIGWTDFQDLNVWINCEGRKSKISEKSFYLPIHLKYYSKSRITPIAETEITLPPLLTANRNTKADYRLCEVDSTGLLLDETVVFQLSHNKTDSEDVLKLSWRISENKGSTDRYYKLFCSSKNRTVNNIIKTEVNIDSVPDFRGEPTYIITNRKGTYYYHKNGGGFAAFVDKDGNDWVSFSSKEGPNGEFRGIPNIRPAGFHPGRGNRRNIVTRILEEGPLKVSIVSERIDGSWNVQWDIYPDELKMTFDGNTKEPYWLLYEGTPGGKLDIEDDTWLRSDGIAGKANEEWRTDLPFPEWVAFSDGTTGKSLIFLHHEDDNCLDQYWPMEGAMTVFGFGRGKNPNQRTVATMTNLPTTMSIVFSNTNDSEQLKEIVSGLLNNYEVNTGLQWQE